MRGLDGGKTEECRGDLVARERRGELSGNGALALRAHLSECSSCRLARQVFVDFDEVSGVDLRDGVRIEKMSVAARRWGHQARRPRARLWPRLLGVPGPLRTLAFAAVVLLIGGSASAAMWWFRHPQPSRPQVESLSGRTPAPRGGKHGRVKARPESVEAVAVAEVAPVAALSAPIDVPAQGLPGGARLAIAAAGDAQPAPKARRRIERRLVAQAGRVAADNGGAPALLLRQAGEARRAGEAERAVSLYRKLQQDFPRSPEATLSAVSLGALLLDRKLPRAALTQFDGYLVASRGGVLIPEALYGRGRALAALGDRQEERRTWDRLLADFPDSAYGPLAKRRLLELK